MSRAVTSLVEALLPDWPVLEPGDRARLLDDVAGFVRREIGLAPFHVRMGILVLTYGFFATAVVRGLGRGFSSWPADRQTAFLAFWGGLSPQTQAMVRVYRSLSTLAFYESAAVLRLLAVEPREDQVARYRQMRSAMLARGST